MRLPRFLAPRTVAHAHCDLPCGVYDPAQARIEAQSVKAIIEKYEGNEDPVFRTRTEAVNDPSVSCRSRSRTTTRSS